jgi:hypothetical protein
VDGSSGGGGLIPYSDVHLQLALSQEMAARTIRYSNAGPLVLLAAHTHMSERELIFKINIPSPETKKISIANGVAPRIY